MQQLLAFALPLGDGAPRPLDVRARTRVPAIEKEHARPDADREFVLTREVVIETDEEQLFDPRLAIALRHVSLRGEPVGA